jgi:molybdate transport system ATP-binding protein
MGVISIQNITVKSQQHTLLREVSLTVNQGEHWIVVGQSGSGKTVLLNTIAGLLRVYSGSIDIDNNYAKHICLVTAKHHFKDLTNTANLYYQQRYNSQDADQALTVQQYLTAKQPANANNAYWTIDKVVHLLRLRPLLHKELIKLSNGETKRLRLASALLSEPTILLLDDPLSGLDKETQQDFDMILEEIIKIGTTIIMSGSGYEIPTPITHVALLNNGTIVKSMPIRYFKPDTAIEGHQINKQQIAELMSNAQPPAYNHIVKLTGINVNYDGHTILNNINWEIKPAESWALFGHNGAGKSTLLSLINGDNPQAYANDIILFDKQRGTGESIWDIKSKIGFLSPELYQYFPTDQLALQVVESGYYDTQGLFRPSSPARAGKAMQWLQTLGIEQYARQPLKSMPASAQRLCLLARALIKTPPLLILDEPCQGLDKQQREHFNILIDTIVETTGLTLIYVTHYASELPSCINHNLTLEGGKVVNIK